MATFTFTSSEIADGMLTQLTGGIISYPNPLNSEIERQSPLYAESKDTLVIFRPSAGSGANGGIVLQEKVLSKLEHARTIKNVILHPVGKKCESGFFDIGGFSKVVGQFLPQLEQLIIWHMKVRNFRLVGLNQLKKLDLVSPQLPEKSKDQEVWELDLVNLEELVLENYTPPTKLFAASLVKCSDIKSFFAHKYWHDEQMPPLILPNCEQFTFRRGDITKKLSLYLPKVKHFSLDACLRLNSLKLMSHAEGKRAAILLDSSAASKIAFATGTDQSSFAFSAQNAILGKKVFKALEVRATNLDEVMDSQEQDDCNLM